MGQGAWRDLAHGSSSTGYAKEEGRSHLEDQLDRPLDRPSFNSIELEVKVKPEKCCFPLDFPLTLNLILLCMRTRSSRSTEDLVELDITTGRKRVQRSQRVQEEPEVLVADTMDVPEGNGNPLGMDSVELGKLDRLVKEMLQTATNRDKGLFHHQCRTTTLRSSWE
ncbi:unnamed protein product [Microthlaspi erraticum]|uniref:Uncharacterized protein n=1 Tax=Microthlaspi erraticum TaxID=1685480 RepID=A0A6D2J654_9BRAS|nr:unnamed protein product [Microthlaspi erraticum]